MTGEPPRSPTSPASGGEEEPTSPACDEEEGGHPEAAGEEEEGGHPEHQGEQEGQHQEHREHSQSRRSHSRRSHRRSASSSSASGSRRRSRSRSHRRSSGSHRSVSEDSFRYPSPVELLGTEELRSALAVRLGAAGLPAGRLYGAEVPKRIARPRPSSPYPVGKLSGPGLTRPKPKPNPFAKINPCPRPPITPARPPITSPPQGPRPPKDPPPPDFWSTRPPHLCDRGGSPSRYIFLVRGILLHIASFLHSLDRLTSGEWYSILHVCMYTYIYIHTHTHACRPGTYTCTCTQPYS